MASITQVRVESVTPVRLAELVTSGRVRLPSFQRSYRWRPSDVEALFDSLQRSYPIGNLLLWQRPAAADRISLGPLVLDVPARADALWVVDGQQRIVSLVGALLAPEDVTDPRFSVYAHLPDLEFRATLRPLDGPWLPVRHASSTQRSLAWQRQNNDLLGDAEYDAVDAVVGALRDYAVPAYIVEADDERAVRQVFDRMNNFGRRLRKEEVFDALHGMQETAEPGDLTALGTSVAASGFGEVAPRELLRSLLALRGADVFRDVHDEFADDDDRRAAFARTEQVLLEVVALLRGDLRIPHSRALPYHAVLPMLAAFVDRFGRPVGRTATLLRRWVWRGAALGANPGGNVPLVRRVLRGVVDASGPEQAALTLLDALPSATGRWRPDLTQVQLNRALARLNVLGLLSLEPREIEPAIFDLPGASTVLAVGDVLDARPPRMARIVPVEVVHPLASSLPALLLHPPLGRDPVGALLDTDATTRTSHGIDEVATTALQQGRWDDFLNRRAGTLTAAITALVDRQAEWGARDHFVAAHMIGRGTLSA